MFLNMPLLNHEQQQQAVEKIQELMAQGMSSGEAIKKIANELREINNTHNVNVIFADE